MWREEVELTATVKSDQYKTHLINSGQDSAKRVGNQSNPTYLS